MEDTKQKPAYESDEINLWEIFLVIWKRKILIIALFLAAVITAAAISYMLPPVFRVAATVSPGWIDTDPSGKAIYIDTAENVKSMIENGTFNQKIILSLKLDPVKYSGMQFRTKLSKNTEAVSVFFDTADTETGIAIMSELLKQITEYYKTRIGTRSSAIDISIEVLKNQNINNENRKTRIVNEKRKIMSDIELLKDKEKLLKTTEKYLMKQISGVEENTRVIMSERSDMLKKSGNDSVALLLYSNTVQQNISYADSLNAQLEKNRIDQNSAQNELARAGIELRNKDTELIDVDTDVMNNLEKINELELKKMRIEGFKILQEPYSNPNPVAPRKTRNVAIAGFISLFLGIFLVFFIEFITKSKAKQ